MVESEARSFRGSDAGRRGVRPRAGQRRHQRHPRTGARSRQAGVGLAASRQGRTFEARVRELAEEKIRAAYQIRSKQARTQALREAGSSVQAALKEQGVDFDPIKVDNLVFEIEARVVRSQILSGEPRIDGRDTRTVRLIEIRTGVLPHPRLRAVHARRDPGPGDLHPGHRAGRAAHRRAGRRVPGPLLFHYNMPPSPPARRPHGLHQAPRSGPRPPGQARADPAAADEEEFPYVMRVVSEITESNGSSSMASVCGGCWR